jgi:flagellar basal-body rod protein FlgB
MNETLDGVFHYYQTAISLRSYRQEVLASNIANADTPGYKARDFDFGTALNTALNHPGSTGSTGTGFPLAKTNPDHLIKDPALTLSAKGHLPGSPVLDPVGHQLAQASAKLEYRVPNQDSADGNTVDMDQERTSFANNAIHYEANLTLLTGRIKDLIAATTA